MRPLQWRSLDHLVGAATRDGVYERCGRNVSETARRLNMRRRTLQAHLAKRAPR